MIGFHGKNIMNGKRTGKNMKTKPSGQFNPSINRLLSFILSISILLTVAAPFAEPQTVEANWVTKTVGALIASLVLQFGAANVDPSYINYLNDPNNTVMQIEIPNDGGVTSLPADLASQIDNALESAPVSVQRSVGDIRTTQAEIINLKDYLQNNGVPPSDVPDVQPATVGENIASSARQLQETGKVEPSIGGQAVGAYAGMVPTVWNYLQNQRYSTMQIGQILQAVADGDITQAQAEDFLYGNQNSIFNKLMTVSTGSSIAEPNTVVNHMKGGGSVATYTNANGTYYSLTNPDQKPFSYKMTGNTFYGLGVYSLQSGSYTWIDYRNGTHSAGLTRMKTSYGTWYEGAGGVSSTTDLSQVSGYQYIGEFSNSNAQAQGILQALGQTAPDKYSPSLVGTNGQLTANINVDPTLNINYFTSNQSPSYIYNNYSMEPIDLGEYSNFAQAIQQQIASDTPQAQISEAVEQYVSQHLVAAPVPTAPPVVPDQPTPDPKPTGTPEQQQENQEIMATPELKDKFPFCIPWDVYYAFAVLEDQREAPALDFDLDLGPAGTHHIEIDFADWEDIASLLRLLELLAFIIGLAIATKRLMGGTGA